MYDTTPRTTIFRSTTSGNVGPNTYLICNPKNTKKNVAPFLSTTPKSLSILSTLFTDAIYDTREKKYKTKGGSSLKNKAKRFVYKPSDVPAPTRYNPKPIQCLKKKLRLDPTKPKLYMCRVPYSTTVAPPSIPSKLDENGYEIDEDGQISKIPPDDEIPEELNIPTTIGQGAAWKWGYRTSERFNRKQYETCGPGPAAYCMKIPKCRRAEEDEKYREMARRFSFVPRFVEAQELKAAKEKQPGPGAYDVVEEKRTKKRSQSIHPRPFIRGAARFSEAALGTPPPTKYNVCDCSRKPKQFSTKCTPFGVESPRFKRDKAGAVPDAFVSTFSV